MKIGDKVIYDFYGRDIITRVKDIKDGELLVVGLASYQPIEMFRPYDNSEYDDRAFEEGTGKTEITDEYGSDSSTYQERID
jgi:hypothetical protein